MDIELLYVKVVKGRRKREVLIVYAAAATAIAAGVMTEWSGVGGMTSKDMASATGGEDCAGSSAIGMLGFSITGSIAGEGAGSKSQGRGIMAAGIILALVHQHWAGNLRTDKANYQVAAQTTPRPLFCLLIAWNSKSMNCDMYRTKGNISRTPLLTMASAERKFTTEEEIDFAFCNER